MLENDLVNMLLDDDDRDCLMFVRDAIEDGSIANPVREVTSGEDALDFLYRRRKHSDAPEIGLAYLDVEMPGMSSPVALRAIRADRSFDRMPVMMMTAICDGKEKRRAARNCANSYAEKPHDSDEFMDTIMEASNY